MPVLVHRLPTWNSTLYAIVINTICRQKYCAAVNICYPYAATCAVMITCSQLKKNDLETPHDWTIHCTLRNDFSLYRECIMMCIRCFVKYCCITLSYILHGSYLLSTITIGIKSQLNWPTRQAPSAPLRPDKYLRLPSCATALWCAVIIIIMHKLL